MNKIHRIFYYHFLYNEEIVKQYDAWTRCWVFSIVYKHNNHAVFEDFYIASSFVEYYSLSFDSDKSYSNQQQLALFLLKGFY